MRELLQGRTELMSSFIDKLLEKKGLTRADIPSTSKTGKVFRRQGVRYTPELERVLALPRRQWGTDPDLVTLLTEEFRRDGGTMVLRPVQAAILAELHDCGGVLASARVSAGKTLCTFLAPKVLGSKRPLLLIPAKLRVKTERDWLRLQEHWVLPTIRIEHYEQLSRADSANLLQNMQPDLIVCDEVHRLKHGKSAVTRRLKRFLAANPGTPFMGLSGTITGRTLHEYWHLLRWSVGDENMPLPAEWAEMAEWADCLDVKGSGTRTAPGALVSFCSEEEAKVLDFGGDVGLQTIRRAYQRRLVETPGVISTGDAQVACSLSITEVRLDLDHLAPHFKVLREEWRTPSGEDFSEPVDLWRHARELVAGFFYRWNPQPPDGWMAVRREWKKFVREALSHSRKLDTELQIVQAIKAGEIADGGLQEKWAATSATFKPNTEAVWIDDVTLKFCANWLKENRGLCWVEHTAFGRKLAQLSGLPYYGRQGLSADGRNVEDEQGSCILSIEANKEGRNLERFSKNLIASCPPNGERLEQLLGRTHRDLQEADEVEVEVILASKELWRGFQRALEDARYTEDTMGVAQKLLFADKTISDGTGTSPLWR